MCNKPDRIKIIADIIEGTLSGQYGRDTAEDLAERCIRTLDMKDPIKWEIGAVWESEESYGYSDFVYAETEQQALDLIPSWTLEHARQGDYTLKVRPFVEKK